MNYVTRIEVKDNLERNRFWEAFKRLEEGTGTKREQKHDRRFVDRYFERIRKYEDAAILSWELHNWRRLPAGASLIVSCGGPPCVNPGHMRIEVPQLLCKVCCEEEQLLHSDERGAERRN
jgi:hypothetical protein